MIKQCVTVVTDHSYTLFDHIHTVLEQYTLASVRYIYSKGKASRLAVLCELGLYHLAVKAISQCLNYRQCLASKPGSLIGQAISNMASMSR